MFERKVAVLAGGLVVALAVSAAVAQESKPAAKPLDNPLAGPKVPDRTGKPTLVERGSDGKVVRIDEWPALAAVKKMKLDETSKKGVAKVEAEQAAALDKFLSGNLLEVAEVAAMFESGKWMQGLVKVKALQNEHPALQQRTQLAQRLSEVLSKQEAEEMRAMVQEYWNALIKEEEESAKTRGEKASAAKVASGEALRLLGQDIKASYERVIGQQVKEFDAFIATLGLSPEQEGRVRKVIEDEFARVKGDSKKYNKTGVFWKVWKELDARQRNELMKQFKERGG